jgi:hypothetical protein
MRVPLFIWFATEGTGYIEELQNPIVFLHSFTTGFALMGEVLFFAPPKKSTQKKGGPEACPESHL